MHNNLECAPSGYIVTSTAALSHPHAPTLCSQPQAPTQNGDFQSHDIVSDASSPVTKRLSNGVVLHPALPSRLARMTQKLMPFLKVMLFSTILQLVSDMATVEYVLMSGQGVVSVMSLPQNACAKAWDHTPLPIMHDADADFFQIQLLYSLFFFSARLQRILWALNCLLLHWP